MKKNYFFVFCLIFYCVSLNAQTFDSARKIGGNDDDIINDVAVNSLGEIYLVGQFEGTVDFNPGPGTATRTSNGAQDVFVLKLDASNNFIWVATFGGAGVDNGQTIKLDDSGQLLISGWFNQTVDFNPDPAFVANRTSNGGQDMFVLKLFPNGAFERVATLGGANVDRITSFGVNFNNDYFATGYFNGTVDFDPGAGVTNLTAGAPIGDVFVMHFSQSLGLIWVKQFEGNASASNNQARANAMAIDTNNNITVAGNFTGTVDFDPGSGVSSLTSPDGKSMYITQLDVNGNFVYSKFINAFGSGGGNPGYGVERIKDLAIDSNNNLIAVGRFLGNTDFDPGTGVANLSSSGNGNNGFVLKLNAIGDFVWVKHMRASASSAYLDITSVVTDINDAIYISGDFISTIDVNPSSANALLSQTNGKYFNVKLNSLGNFEWAVNYGKPTNTGVINASFFSGFKYYNVGVFDVGGVDFDPSANTYNLSSTGGANGVKDGFLQILLENTLSSDNFLSSEEISIFPNPTKEFIIIKSREILNYEILTLEGKRLLNGTYINGLDKIDVSSLSSGMYIVSITNENKTQRMTHKILKQ